MKFSRRLDERYLEQSAWGPHGSRLGAVHCEAGTDAHALHAHLCDGGTLAEFQRRRRHHPDELLALDCEVLIPAALGGLIHGGNADSIRAKVVLEGANGPTTRAADDILQDNGVFVVPDVLANAGRVVVSYFEWVQNLQHFRWSEEDVNDRLGVIMTRAYRQVASRAFEDHVPMSTVAFELGIERVVDAAKLRGTSPDITA